MRRILLIIAAVIILLGIGVGIYFFFFANKPTLSVSTGASLPSSGNEQGTGNQATPATQGLGVAVGGAGTLVAPRLIRITDTPVALGAVAVYTPGTPPVVGTTTASTTASLGTDPDVQINYIDRESGNIYGFTAHARTLTRLTNKTLPGIQEASWLSDGSLAYVRFLATTGTDEHVDTYALPTDGTNGYFLQQDLEQVATQATSTVLTLLTSTNGSTATLSTPLGTQVRTLFSSALGALHIAFAGAGYTATTKASASSDGYAFTVDPKTGTFTRALGPLSGLSTLPSPSGKLLLYSFLNNGKISLGVLDLTTHVAVALPLATFSEKCAWSPDSTNLYCAVPTNLSGTLPDDWYQGAVHFSDRLWKIDLAGRVATLIIDPKQAGSVDIDAVGLTLDRTSDVLVFTNRRDGTLWVYDLY